MDDTPTKVVFRQWRTKPYEIIALFPEIPADLNGYKCSSYMHVGQHGAADYEGVVAATRPAYPKNLRDTPDDVAAEVDELMREIEGLGYVLETVRRCTPAMRRARRDEARRIRFHNQGGDTEADTILAGA